MTGSDWEILGVIAAGLALVVVPVTVDAYRRYRTPRSLLCPKTGLLAGVRVDPLSAALGSAFDRLPSRVGDCSLWPANRGCGQECLDRVRAGENAAPDAAR
jgi:hypothetical protein